MRFCCQQRGKGENCKRETSLGPQQPSPAGWEELRLYALLDTTLLHDHILTVEREHRASARMQSGCRDIQAEGLESPRAQWELRKQSLPSWGPGEFNRDHSRKKRKKVITAQENISGLGMQSQNFVFLFINRQMIITSRTLNISIQRALLKNK